MGPWGLERKSSEKKPAEGCRRRGAGCPRPRALLPAHEGTRGGVAPVSHLTFNLLWQPPDSGLCAPCPSPRTASQCLGRSNHSEGRADMSLHTRSPSRPPSAFRMKPSCRVPPATPRPSAPSPALLGSYTGLVPPIPHPPAPHPWPATRCCTFARAAPSHPTGSSANPAQRSRPQSGFP